MEHALCSIALSEILWICVGVCDRTLDDQVGNFRAMYVVRLGHGADDDIGIFPH